MMYRDKTRKRANAMSEENVDSDRDRAVGRCPARSGRRRARQDRPSRATAVARRHALTLFAYGVVVNQGRLNFGRLIRVYIAVFFLISQILAFAFFREVPAYKTIAGGLLIVIGGAVIML
jgi:drug/metabolite transporter superfamily protein YnfA